MKKETQKMKRERVIRWFESRTLMQKFIAILVLRCAALFPASIFAAGKLKNIIKISALVPDFA